MFRQCDILEMFRQFDILEMFRQCDILEMFRQFDILEMFRQCDILEMFRQFDILEMFRQCDILEMFRQCDILEMFRQCDIFCVIIVMIYFSLLTSTEISVAIRILQSNINIWLQGRDGQNNICFTKGRIYINSSLSRNVDLLLHQNHFKLLIKNSNEQNGYQFHSTRITKQPKSNEDSFSKLQSTVAKIRNILLSFEYIRKENKYLNLNFIFIIVKIYIRSFKRSKYFIRLFFFLANKCEHRKVLSKRQVWMSIFHIIRLN